ncbi:MAG: peptide chain release factor N(5)-glutamine methyltransferase [Verrucomicrobiota bacterium]|nr:peptide chain release factor N(5)-glutamine methyltransferase [Verrucomicrobiota bacterium]
MKTIGEVLQLSTQFLAERKIERARRLAEELLAATLQMKRMDLYLQFDRPVEETELVLLREGLKRCGKGEPVEYVLGEVEFAGCQLAIDRSVLIPRPETEILIDLIVKEIGPAQGKVLWDVCAGSGGLGLALKKALPDLEVILSDISPEAVAIGQKNSQKNGLEVEFRTGDLLAPFAGEQADFVTCNPPYVTETEYLNLQPSVRDFEPRRALVGGERGTEFYERLSCDLPLHLKPGGKVFLEIGATQGEAVKKIFAGGPWARGELKKDWSGHDRFFFLEKQ